MTLRVITGVVGGHTKSRFHNVMDVMSWFRPLKHHIPKFGTLLSRRVTAMTRLYELVSRRMVTSRDRQDRTEISKLESFEI